MENIIYLIMTNGNYPTSAAVACLESLKKEFHDILFQKNLDDVIEYGLSKELKGKLELKFDYYNKNKDITSESIEKLKSEIVKLDNEVRNAVKELGYRGENLQVMESKAENLVEASESQVRNFNVKNKIKYRNYLN